MKKFEEKRPDSGPEELFDATLWKQAWGVIAKHHSKPIVRNYLQTVGVQPSAELALEVIQKRLREDPQFAQRSLDFRFYPVRLDLYFDVFLDPSTMRVVGYGYGG